MENEIDTEYYINNMAIYSNMVMWSYCVKVYIYYIESFDSRKVQMTHPNMDIHVLYI